MEERRKFIEACRDPQVNLTAICRRFAISTKTGYKWLARYEALGEAGLKDQPRRALRTPHRTDDRLVEVVLELRKEHPTWGPKKLRGFLLHAQPEMTWPAASTIGDVLKRFGMIRPRRRRLRAIWSGLELSPGLQPNDLWCVDFKGHFALGDRTRCHPLTLTDHASRYLLKCEAVSEPRTEPVREQFELAFREFGMPLRVRSDNGPPFASVGAGGLSALSVWLLKLGVLPERIEPGCPQQNARHERMHRTLKAEATEPPAATRPAQNLVFAAYRHEFNDVRPHEALGQRTPASLYELSPRAYPAELRSPEYRDDAKVRWARSTGQISWRGEAVMTSRCLGGEPIGLRQVSETNWEAYYGPVLLGVLDDRDVKPRLRRVERSTVGISNGDGDALRAFPVDRQTAPDHTKAPSPETDVDEFSAFWKDDSEPGR